MPKYGDTFWIKFDPQQYLVILQALHRIQEMIQHLAPTDDPAKLAALSAKLKESADALKAAVDANQVSPK